MTKPDGPTFNVEDAAWANKLIDCLEEFRKINQHVTANQILTFLHIALNDNIHQKLLEEKVDLDNGTISRICAILSERGLKKRDAKAMNLIRIDNDPNDYRQRVQNLSHHGKLMFNALRKIMKGR